MGKLFKSFEILCTDFEYILKKEGIVFKENIIERMIIINDIRYVVEIMKFQALFVVATYYYYGCKHVSLLYICMYVCIFFKILTGKKTLLIKHNMYVTVVPEGEKL